MATQKSSWLKKQRAKIQAGVVVLCHICEQPISLGGDKGKGSLTADHIIPKALGGTDGRDNLQPAHARCNHKRGTMVMHQFRKATKGEALLKRAIKLIEKYENGERIEVKVIKD